uniref:hypothetical protein n=1 Tax=Prosthecobacter sp. TaxID=1965333 RepID=UPI0037839C18
MKRLLSIRTLIWTMAVFTVLVVLAYFIENWTGERALADARSRLERAGETLDFATLIPKPVLEDVNFCAFGPLADLTLKNQGSGSPVHEDLRKLDWSSAEFNDKRPPLPALNGGCSLAQPFDFKSTTEYLRESKYVEITAEAGPAMVLTAIDHQHPLPKQLSDVAPARTEAVFVPAVGAGYDGPPMQTPRLHLSSIIATVRALALRSQIATAAGDTGEATHSILASLRFTQAVGQNPTLIDLLIAEATSIYELNSLWSLLQHHEATEGQLAALQQGLERQDFMRWALQAMRGELLFQIDNIEWLKRRPGERIKLYDLAVKAFDGDEMPWWGDLCARSIPDGWFDHNAANIIRLYSAWMLEPLLSGNVESINHGIDTLERILSEDKGITSPHHMLPALSLPTSWTVLRPSIYSEAVRRQACTAVAIERYRLAHAKLPATLGELVPAFLAIVPLDPIDRQPMRYRIEGSAFTLWSIAMDRNDDRGKLPTEKKARHIEWPKYTGDWVWKN